MQRSDQGTTVMNGPTDSTTARPWKEILTARSSSSVRRIFLAYERGGWWAGLLGGQHPSEVYLWHPGSTFPVSERAG